MDIEKDQYEKINTLTAELKELAGAVDTANAINAELVKLLRKAITYMFWTILLLIGTIIYGAIGKEGFYAVRSLPSNVANINPPAPPPDNRIILT